MMSTHTRPSAGLTVAAVTVLCTVSLTRAAEGPHHPDQQRRRQRPRDRPRDQQGGRRHRRDRGEPWRRSRPRRQPHLHQRRSREHARCRRRARRLQGHQEGPAQRPPQQHRRRPDGRRVYVGIRDPEPGGVDVIDTTSMKMVKTIPTKGSDPQSRTSRPTASMSSQVRSPGKTVNVIDAKTETPVWTLKMDLGIRPMTFATNADGSTKWIFVQLTGLNGFAVVDFATHKEIKRIKTIRTSRRESRRCPKDRIRRTAWRSPPTARRSSSAAG